MSETVKPPAPPEPKALVLIGETGVQLRNLEEAMRFCKYVVASGVAPQGDNEATVFVKLQAGAELGFPPMRALAALVVVNGRLSMMGEALLAKIRASRVATVHVYNEGADDARCGVFEFQRRDTGEAGKVTFSVADAKRAGLWNKKSNSGKDTPWSGGFGDDMLIWRAVSRGSKRYFSDITMGFESAEVARDLPPTEVVASTPERPTLPPATPDPLLAAATAGEHASHSDVEVPLVDKPPFEDHAAADRALADEDGQGRLLEPTKPRHRG